MRCSGWWSRSTPARLAGARKGEKPLPEVWEHPFTGEQQQTDVAGLLDQAERTGAAYMLAAQGYWQGKLRLERAMEVIGSRSYLSGLEDARSAPARQQEPAPAEQPEPEPAVEAELQQQPRWEDIDISGELDDNSVG